MPNTPNLSHIQNWIFDLDNTLYNASVSFFDQIDRKMTDFISRYLQLDPTKARQIQKDYLAEYGTSLSGLMAVHGMDPAEFLEYVHDVDLSLLKPDAQLRQKIEALPGRKFIYTNGSRFQSPNAAPILNFAMSSALTLRQRYSSKTGCVTLKCQNIWACPQCLSQAMPIGHMSQRPRAPLVLRLRPIMLIISRATFQIGCRFTAKHILTPTTS